MQAYRALKHKHNINVAFHKTEVASFFDYIQVESARKLGQHNHWLKRLARIPAVHEEYLIQETIDDIERSSRYCSPAQKASGRCSQGPKCTQVIQTMDKCWPTKRKHFIFAIQTSNSITDENLEHIKEALETMLYYVLASNENRVSIFQWSYYQQQLCQMQNSNSQIYENCLSPDKFKRYRHNSVDTIGALDYAKGMVTKSSAYDETVIFITDGGLNTSWWPVNWFTRITTKAHELRKATSYSKTTVKAIGIGMDYSNKRSDRYKELVQIGGSARNTYQFPDYRTFTEQRFEFQQFICR